MLLTTKRLIGSFKDLQKFLKDNLLILLLFSFLFNSSLGFFDKNFFIRGILIDYYIPRIYLNHLFFVLLILVFYKRILKYKKYLLLIFFILLVNVLFSSNIFLSLMYLSRRMVFLPLVFVLIDIARFDLDKNFFWKALYTLNLFYFLFFIIQFLYQKSFFSFFPFGFYYYEGVAFGLDYINFFGVKKVIPLGNFPHPNVFAAFLSFINIFYLKRKSKISFLFFIINVFTISILGSISAFIFNFFLLLFSLVKKIETSYFFLLFALVFVFILSFQFSYKYVSIQSRLEQFAASFYLLSNYPLFGVGIGNYVSSIPFFENFSKRVYDLQPVHNIFILFLIEFGFFGAFIFLVSFFNRFKSYLKITPFLLFLLIFGSFDHFLFTLNQGLLLLTLTIALHKTIIDTHG